MTFLNSKFTESPIKYLAVYIHPDLGSPPLTFVDHPLGTRCQHTDIL